MEKKKINNYALNLDENTEKQFESCYNQDFVYKAALMPDAHSGYVAPIGSVFITKNYIVPAWIGYDIGCGMIACRIKKKGILSDICAYSKEIFDRVNQQIPMGKGNMNNENNITDKSKEDFKNLIEKFKQKEYDKNILNYIENNAFKNLGTLGSGNHFIEMGYGLYENSSDEVWLIIHSGSRGIGHFVATHYMKKASNNEDYEKTYPLKIDTKEGKEYLNVLDFCLEFALLNRLEMAYKVRDILREILNDSNLNLDLWVNKNHNHAVKEGDYYIHRKGATPAKLGEKGVIPANMKDGSFLVEGLGNKDFLESSSHGAGRLLSRKEAKLKLSMEDFKNTMDGILCNLSENILDESPKAYKNIYDVMESQKESVKIITQIKPIINWKG
jgi:tRNA-splicing ligase RtcB